MLQAMRYSYINAAILVEHRNDMGEISAVY